MSLRHLPKIIDRRGVETHTSTEHQHNSSQAHAASARIRASALSRLPSRSFTNASEAARPRLGPTIHQTRKKLSGQNWTRGGSRWGRCDDRERRAEKIRTRVVKVLPRRARVNRANRIKAPRCAIVQAGLDQFQILRSRRIGGGSIQSRSASRRSSRLPRNAELLYQHQAGGNHQLPRPGAVHACNCKCVICWSVNPASSSPSKIFTVLYPPIYRQRRHGQANRRLRQIA